MLLDQLSVHSFIQTNQIKTENGKALDFHTHRYLFDIYRDNSPNLCCVKAGQIGFSTMAILKTFWLAYYKKMRIGYILPTADMSQKFVGSKVDPIIKQNKVILDWMKDKDAVELKKVGNGFIHYVGAQTPTAAIMLTFDMIIGDEYDKAPQHILEMFDSRMQHSDYKWKWIFSNPTIPDFGVDRYWQMSDKKKWHIKHSCKEIYVLDESCIDYQTENYRCPKCKGQITDDNRRMGEWIATAEGKWSGYWIPLWLNPMVKASEIAEHKRMKTKEYFANFVAGLPYVNSTNMLTQQILESNLLDQVNMQEGRIIIGVDTGHNIHYTVANKDGIFFHGYCKSVAEMEFKVGYDPYDELDKLMQKFPRAIMIADQGGDLIGIRKLQAKYVGRVYLCWFTKETKTQELMRWVDEEDGKPVCKVLVDRNRMIQMVVDEWREQRFPIYGKLEDWQPFFDHCLNVYRVKEIQGQDENDPQYNWRWIWKRKGADHFMLSAVYARVGLDRFGMDLARVISKNGALAGVPRAGNFTIETPSDTSYLGNEIEWNK